MLVLSIHEQMSPELLFFSCGSINIACDQPQAADQEVGYHAIKNYLFIPPKPI